MAGVRILQDGRLVLSDGTKLDLEHVWLGRDEARSCAASADYVVHSTGLGTTDITSDPERIATLLQLVAGGEGDVGARRYKASGTVALVLHQFH